MKCIALFILLDLIIKHKKTPCLITTLNKGMGEIFHFKQRGMFVM